jgi:hypothetical protein
MVMEGNRLGQLGPGVGEDTTIPKYFGRHKGQCSSYKKPLERKESIDRITPTFIFKCPPKLLGPGGTPTSRELTLARNPFPHTSIKTY